MAQDKLDRLTPELFKGGPAEYLACTIAQELRNEPHFCKIFGDSVVDYEREDFSMRELPAVRIYIMDYTKEHESHYINGDVHLDVIMPPSIRRAETETYPSRIAAALLQQFRRPNYFNRLVEIVPGLNELGKVFHVNKELVFQNTEMNDECPVVKITLNFRMDLKIWDDYLESQGRTKDDPFDVTLRDLDEIAATIQGIRVNDDLTTGDIKLMSDQKIGE